MTLGSWIIATPIMGAVFYWYNYLFIRWHINYWQWCLLGLIGLYATLNIKWLRHITAIIFVVALVCQCLYWFDILKLPLIKP